MDFVVNLDFPRVIERTFYLGKLISPIVEENVPFILAYSYTEYDDYGVIVKFKNGETKKIPAGLLLRISVWREQLLKNEPKLEINFDESYEIFNKLIEFSLTDTIGYLNSTDGYCLSNLSLDLKFPHLKTLLKNAQSNPFEMIPKSINNDGIITNQIVFDSVVEKFVDKPEQFLRHPSFKTLPPLVKEAIMIELIIAMKFHSAVCSH
jgi:hypothetical protein